MHLKVGKIYKLEKKIGSGSFGEIYSAINTKNNQEVTIYYIKYAIKLE